MKVETRNQQHAFEIQVYLDDLPPEAIRVELYADHATTGGSVRQEMRPIDGMVRGVGPCLYGATVSADRPSADYTARLIPSHDGVAIPMEEARILWQG